MSVSKIENFAEHDADEIAAYTLKADDLYPVRGATLHFNEIGKNSYKCSINGEPPDVIVTYVTDNEARIQLASGGKVWIVRAKQGKAASSFQIAIAILECAGKEIEPETTS